MTDSRWKNLALEVIGCFVSALGLYSFAGGSFWVGRPGCR